jgi:hypothetical protein
MTDPKKLKLSLRYSKAVILEYYKKSVNIQNIQLNNDKNAKQTIESIITILKLDTKIKLGHIEFDRYENLIFEIESLDNLPSEDFVSAINHFQNEITGVIEKQKSEEKIKKAIPYGFTDDNPDAIQVITAIQNFYKKVEAEDYIINLGQTNKSREEVLLTYDNPQNNLFYFDVKSTATAKKVVDFLRKKGYKFIENEKGTVLFAFTYYKKRGFFS